MMIWKSGETERPDASALGTNADEYCPEWICKPKLLESFSLREETDI